ncbi:Armadillo-type fold [Trinorchestia longiramus]|nr:Armadillo-type fold [Trinorchestia longiramus]
MDPSKAKVIMKLLSSKHLQVKGLKELKKRLLDFANIAVFRKLKLVPILLKIIEAHGSICAQKTSGDACSNEDPSQSTLEDKDKLIVESMDVQELEFEDLQRLKDLSYSEAQRAETSFVPLVNIDQVDTNSEQVVLYTLSLLCTMLQDHGAKHQCEGLEGVRIVMPFITCKSQLIADRAVRATARMVELPGNNRDMFIRFKGPKLLLDQLLKPNFEDVSFQKTLLIAIRIVSCCGSCCEAVLRHKGLETVCVVGLPSVSLQQPAVAIIATYSSLQQQEALIQLLDGTKELSLLLRTWQDNRDCASIHASTLRVMVNLVQLASRATEQLHSNVRQNWVAGGGRREEGGGLGKDGYQRGNANLTALRLRLLKAFFAIKTATPLVTEIASYEGAAGEKIVSTLCTLFMLYLRHSHRLHPAASRFLSTISQTPCSIQGLLDTFFPAYVAVQLCESLVNSKKKRNSCNCGFCCNGKVTCNLEKSCSSPESGTFTSCAKSEAKLSSSSSSLDNYNRSLDASGASCSALKTKQPEGHNACMARSSNTTIDLHKEDSEHSKGSRENGRCSLQSTNVCNECTMLVTGGQSFLLNMSKFFGHVHRYGSQEAGNRLKPNAPACVRETCSLNIPHIARCPSQLQQLMLNGGCLQDIFSVLREDEPPSAVRYIYAAAALHALANAVDICGQTPLGKGCALCLISAAAEDEADEINDFAGTLQPPHVKATEKIHKDSSSGKKKEASENSSALHGKCFWSEQVGHDVTLMCSAGDEDELMENQETWREDEDEYSEEELTDAEGFLDDDDSKTSDIPTNRKTLNSKSGDELSSLKMNVCDDDTSHGDRVNASGKNYFPEQKSDAGIQAHRSILCGASEVWAVMLGEQGWREATDGVIRVGGLGQHALTAIVHHLYGCTCAALSSLTLHEYVELLHACHMYGLKQLQNYAAHRIVQTCSTAMDVLTVYHASVGLVDKDVITGVLVRMIACKDVRSWRRAQWLHTLAHAPPGEQLLNNIHSLLFHALEANKNTCTCDTSQGLYMTSNSVYSKLI